MEKGAQIWPLSTSAAGDLGVFGSQRIYVDVVGKCQVHVGLHVYADFGTIVVEVELT